MCVGLVYIILKACPLHKAGRWMPPNQGDTQGRNQLGRGGSGTPPLASRQHPPPLLIRKMLVTIKVKPTLVKFHSLSYVKSFGMERRSKNIWPWNFGASRSPWTRTPGREIPLKPENNIFQTFLHQQQNSTRKYTGKNIEKRNNIEDKVWNGITNQGQS